ncbi:MAG: BatD family protein [Bacteroidia bacterium]
MEKRILLVSCLMIFLQMVYGQEIRLFTGKPFITLDEQLQLILIVTGNPLPSTPVFPEMDGFSKVSANAPALSRGQGREIHYVQSYYPLRTGKFTVPSFEVITPSGTKRTRKLLIEVEKPSILYKFEDITTQATVRLVFSRDTCFVGDQITAEIRASVTTGKEKFLRFLPVSIEELARQIDLTGLQIEGISNPESAHSIHIDGKTEFTLAKLYLFPTRPGNFTLQHITLQTEQQQIARNTSAADRRKGANRRVNPGQMAVPPASFYARPLPQTHFTKAPASGVFSIFHEVSRKTYTTGENIRLEIAISGTGNPDWVKTPVIHENEKLIYFEPHIYTSREFVDSALVSRKQFVYEIIPAYPGTFNLGPVLFYYFNTQNQSYDSLEIDVIPVTVTGDDIPQLMEVSALNHFYDRAFEVAKTQPVPSRAYAPWLVLVFLTFSGVFMVSGRRFY